ncbi:hypothetical protein HNY73_002988 [Argiope bruennichi]|uniref:Uncharacterized protein n=1 Tax=Argiope bruennichi TaxID=94029 RepID=A0A8T0FZM1_ARGBR|nr:hypothetical protein HNY73_002988 [Argiope bruennichi]
MTSTTTNSTSDNDANNKKSTIRLGGKPFQFKQKASRWHKTAVHNSVEQAVVAMATLYNAWTIALRIAFPEIRQVNIDRCFLNFRWHLKEITCLSVRNHYTNRKYILMTLLQTENTRSL